jgi:hypothetical protein
MRCSLTASTMRFWFVFHSSYVVRSRPGPVMWHFEQRSSKIGLMSVAQLTVPATPLCSVNWLTRAARMAPV